MALATLSIDIEARLARLEADMGKAARITERRSAEMGKSMDRLRGVGARLAVAMAAYFTVDTFKNLIVGSANALDALNDLKDATGASIENLSALEYVAMRNGGTLEEVGGILVKFNNVLKESDGKNSASQALRAIGVDAEELKRIDPAEALERVAVALKGFADDGTKARIVQELFGKSIREAAPYLNDLADMGLKNATATTEQALAAEQFNKQIYQLQTNLSIAARTVVGELIPAFNKLFSLAKSGDIGLFGFGGDLYKKRQELQGALNDQKLALGDFVAYKSQGTIANTLQFGDVGGVEGIAKRLKDANARVASLRAQVYQADGVGPKAPALSGPPVPDDLLARRLQQAADEAEKKKTKTKVGAGSRTASTREPAISDELRYLKSLGDQVERTKDLSAAERVLADIQSGRYKFTEDQEGQARDFAQQIDQAKAYEAVMRDLSEIESEALSNLERSQEDMAQRAGQYLEASLTDAERLRAVLADIDLLYKAGAFGAVGSAEAIEKMGKAIDGAKRGTDELAGAYRDVADAIKTAVFEGGDLGEMLEDIAKKKLLIEPLSDAIDGLFKGLQNGGASVGGSAGGGGGLGSLLSLGNLIGGVGSLLGFADGGSPPVGRVSMVGERGPELFLPKVPGTIIPNHKLGGVGGQVVNITQHVTVGQGVSAAQVAAAMNYTKDATTQSVMQALRRNNPGLVA